MKYFMLNNGFKLPQVTRNILTINVFVWITCSLSKLFGIRLVDIFGLHYVQSRGFFLYQLITYMFVHETFSHLFFNMFALFMFGGTIEIVWGRRRFFTYYVVTGIGAGLVQLVVFYIKIHLGLELGSQELLYIYDFIPVTIGASGAIFGLLLAFGMLFPETSLYMMFIPIPIKAKYFVLGYGILEFFCGVSNCSDDNVAHFAHLGGMLFGIFMILYWKRKS